MSGKIYLICKDGEPKYVGFTSRTIEERWKEHCKEAKRRKCVFHKAILKYGPEAFTIELVADYLNEDFALNVCEEFWIRHLGTHADNGGYNMSYGGEMPPSHKGRKLSPEQCKQRSERLMGHEVSEATRQKIRDAKLGKKRGPHSEDARRKMSEAHMGKTMPPVTDEWRRKQSEAHKGRIFTEEHRKKLSEANYRRWAKSKGNHNEISTRHSNHQRPS